MNVDNITQKHQRAFQLREKNRRGCRECPEGSAADQAGIQPGDVIKDMNRSPIREPERLSTALKQEQRPAPSSS